MTTLEANSNRKSLKRVILRAVWLLGLLLAITVGILCWVWSQDIEPVDDTHILPTFTEGGGPNNPLITYARELEKLPDPGYDKLPQDVKERKKGQERALADFLAKPQVVSQMELWDELMQTDPTLWRLRFQDHLPFKANDIGPNLKRLHLNVVLQRLRATMLAREGKEREAIELAFQIIKMGEGLAKAEGMIVQFLLAISAQHMGYETLQDILSEYNLDEALMTDVLKRLSHVESLRNSLQTSFRIQYQFLKDILGEAAAHAALSANPSPSVSWFARKSIKNNQTLSLMLETYAPLIEATTESASDLIDASEVPRRNMEAWKRKGWIRLLDRNWMGHTLVGMSTPTYGRIVERCVANEIIPELLKLNVILRRYELKHGKLPESLDGLNDDISFPLDPFSGKPFCWNSVRQRIYSVWKNEIDDGGEFHEALTTRRDPLDYGMDYIWSPQYRQGRDKR